MTKVQRKDLKVGTVYYMGNHKRDKGVFVGRDEDSIYFDCGTDHDYYCSVIPGREHLVAFNLEGSGFEKIN